MDQICVGMPCAVTHNIAECCRPGQQRHRQRTNCRFLNPIFGSDRGCTLEGRFLPKNHCYCQQQDNNSSANLHRPERYTEQS